MSSECRQMTHGPSLICIMFLITFWSEVCEMMHVINTWAEWSGRQSPPWLMRAKYTLTDNRPEDCGVLIKMLCPFIQIHTVHCVIDFHSTFTCLAFEQRTNATADSRHMKSQLTKDALLSLTKMKIENENNKWMLLFIFSGEICLSEKASQVGWIN